MNDFWMQRMRHLIGEFLPNCGASRADYSSGFAGSIFLFHPQADCFAHPKSLSKEEAQELSLPRHPYPAHIAVDGQGIGPYPFPNASHGPRHKAFTHFLCNPRPKAQGPYPVPGAVHGPRNRCVLDQFLVQFMAQSIGPHTVPDAVYGPRHRVHTKPIVQFMAQIKVADAVRGPKNRPFPSP
eukprot:1159778-Pelagomonas_calceolata.AAC.12